MRGTTYNDIADTCGVAKCRFFDGLARLMEDATLRRALAHGARATAAGRGWDAIYDRLLDDYQMVITRRRGARAA